MQLFSETHSKPFQGLVKKIVLPENTAKRSLLEHKRQLWLRGCGMFYQIVSLFCSHGIHCFHWSQYHLYFSLKATSSSGVTWEHQTEFSSIYTLTSTLDAIMQRSKDYITIFRGWLLSSDAVNLRLPSPHSHDYTPAKASVTREFIFSNKSPKPYVCFLRIHCESQIPKTFKGISPQLYGDFSTYTPKIHLRSFFFSSPKGFEARVKNPPEMRIVWRPCTFICLIFNYIVFGAINIVSGFRNRPAAAVKLQDYVESGRRVESTLLTEETRPVMHRHPLRSVF